MPTKETEQFALTSETDRSPALTPVADVPVSAMLQAVLASKMTAESVGVVERMAALYERMQAKDAEKQFAEAFVRVQANMPRIEAVKGVPDKFGNIKYYYSPLEEIMPKVMPVLRQNGFALSFDSEIKEDRVILSCTLMHIGGHHKTNVSMAKIGSGPPGSSGAQADGAAATYAKRRALCDALAIISDIDTDGADARNEGAPITADKAAYLKELIQETKSDEARFLKYAGAASYEEIGSARYDSLVAELHKRAGR